MAGACRQCHADRWRQHVPSPSSALACSAAFSEQKPTDGFAVEVGERDNRLPGGERQCIVLAWGALA